MNFFFNDTATTEIYTLSLHDALPISTKVHLVKAMVFPVVMYGCESWAIKKAEIGRAHV